ncbi:MAG: hypothetical protein Q9220_003479 [cf. Caloplaca sp. 1 TL-2023]
MSDPEGDLQMRSSTEPSEDDLDAMFPDANEPPNNSVHTPEPSISKNLQQFSELSPPTSQDPVVDSRNFGSETMDVGGGSGSGDIEYGQGDSFGESAGSRALSIADREPGASWNNRKQRDEEERTREHVLDKGFSLRECWKDYYYRSVG